VLSVRRVLVLLIVIVVLAAGGWYYLRERSASDPLAAFALSQWDVHQVELAFRVTGRIAEMKMQEGDRTAAGALLAQWIVCHSRNDVAAASAMSIRPEPSR